MNFEQYYDKLPNFIKYNSFVYNSFISLASKLRKLNKSSKQSDSQNQLLNILFTSCDIKVNGSLRDLQLLYVELLRFIDNVCSKYDIDYWIDYGTLLGAVRHGGFIPWDDDIDISIMREDYEKLIDVLPLEMKKYNILMENCGLSLLVGGHKNYFEGFTSVYDVNDNENILSDTKFNFLQIAWLKPYVKIDIFPKDYIVDSQLDKYSKNYGAVKYKFNKDLKNDGNINFFEELSNRKAEIGQTNEKTSYCACSLDHIITEPPLIFRMDDIFPLKTIKFEGYYFKCPYNEYECLKTRFSENYMKIPKIIDNHDIFKFIESQFDSKEEMDLSFKESYVYLKELNDNFI